MENGEGGQDPSVGFEWCQWRLQCGIVMKMRGPDLIESGCIHEGTANSMVHVGGRAGIVSASQGNDEALRVIKGVFIVSMVPGNLEGLAEVNLICAACQSKGRCSGSASSSVGIAVWIIVHCIHVVKLAPSQLLIQLVVVGINGPAFLCH